jgi:hypothetical protein
VLSRPELSHWITHCVLLSTNSILPIWIWIKFLLAVQFSSTSHPWFSTTSIMSDRHPLPSFSEPPLDISSTLNEGNQVGNEAEGSTESIFVPSSPIVGSNNQSLSNSIQETKQVAGGCQSHTIPGTFYSSHQILQILPSEVSVNLASHHVLTFCLHISAIALPVSPSALPRFGPCVFQEDGKTLKTCEQTSCSLSNMFLIC